MSPKIFSVILLLSLILFLPFASVQADDGDTPTVGELVINEIMINPAGSEPGGEWIEIVNISGETRDLNGCSITDGEDTYTWSTSQL